MQNRFESPDVIITDVMARHAKWRANKPALIIDDTKLTWRQFNQRINRVANGLRNLGLQKGDKVALLMKNSIEMPEIIFGTIKAGGVIVPLSAMLDGDALARMINDSYSKFLFVGPELLNTISPYRDQLSYIPRNSFISVGTNTEEWNSYLGLIQNSLEEEPEIKLTYEDEFNIMYTSGTTGMPKGILHTHHNRFHFCMLIASELKIHSDTIAIATVTLNTNGGWIMLLPTLFFGGTLVIMSRFDTKTFLELVNRERCTHTFMVPTQYSAILEDPNLNGYDMSSMKIWLTGGAALKAKDKNEILEKFPGELVELWGCTEGPCTTISGDNIRKKMDSVGIPAYGGDIRIIDDEGREVSDGKVGEIVGVNAFIMPEYYGLPDKTAEAIWSDSSGKKYFKTGDIGRIDDDGFLYILDRKKDMIVSGGINIFASDIEEVVIKYPEVKDVTVIGIPHSKWGETPLALVIRKDDATVSEDELKEWINGKLGKYQRISGVEFRDDFPRNALGKVLKRELREPYWKIGDTQN